MSQKFECKVFVISLKSAARRREHIENELKRVGVEYELVDAVEGKNLDLKADARVDYRAVEKLPHLMTPSMIGCCLSHANIYEMIVERNIRCALILEDDCILPENMSELIAAAEKRITPLEVIMFYYSGYGDCYLSRVGAEKISTAHELLYPMSLWKTISTTAYMIRIDACRRFLEFLFPIHATPDAWPLFYENKVINSMRCIYPRPVDTALFKSTVGYISPRSSLGKLLAFIDRYKVFPAYQYLKYRRQKIKDQRYVYKMTDEKSPFQLTSETQL
jgi:glycosyl transferase family 25